MKRGGDTVASRPAAVRSGRLTRRKYSHEDRAHWLARQMLIGGDADRSRLVELANVHIKFLVRMHAALKMDMV